MTSSLMQGDASDSTQLNHRDRGNSGLLAGRFYLPASLLLPCQCHSHILPRSQRTGHGGRHVKGHHGSTDCSAAVGHLSTHASRPALENRTGVSGKSCEREPCPEQILQLTVSGVTQDSEERTVPLPGHLFPAAFLVPRWRLCQQGAVQA